MEGPEATGEAVRVWLAATLPTRLTALEARLGLPAGALPRPAQVLAQEQGPIALEDWPTIYVLPQGLTRMDLVNVDDDGSELYRCRYPVQLLTWVRSADGYAATDVLRKRYALAVREALLARRSVAATGAREVATDPASIRENYGPVMTDTAGRTLAGTETTVDVIAHELMPGSKPLGMASEFLVTVDGDTGAVRPHPALD